MTDSRPPLGSASRRDRRPPMLDLSASGFGARHWLAWFPSEFPWALLAAGVAGAALVLLVVYAIGGRNDGALDARLAHAEQQLAALIARPAAPDVNTVDDLAGRLTRLETLSDPRLTARLGALDSDLKVLSERITAIGRRNDEMAAIAGDVRQRSEATSASLADIAQRLARLTPPNITREEIDGLAGRVGAVERSAGTLETDLRRRSAAAGSDPALRLAVVAVVLRSAVERGDPFATELQVARALAADPAVLAPLEPFAASGAPSAAELVRELLPIAPVLAQAPQAARDVSFLERLQASAEKLVRVRPVEEVPGDEPAAIVARVAVRAAQRDLRGALTELAKLPAPLRAPAQTWIAKAQAREAAIDACRQFAAEAVAALRG